MPLRGSAQAFHGVRELMNRTVAVMQPYVFPYVGYFSLIEASDIFVFYDDVHFIQQGWINRNRILVNGQPFRFTIPLSNGSSNELIMDVRTHGFERFRTKFIRQVGQAYTKSPFRDTALAYIEDVFSGDCALIADIAMRSVTEFYKLLGVERTFHRSSVLSPESRGHGRSDRLIEMTRLCNADSYVNSAAGEALYDRTYFRERGIELRFFTPELAAYEQPGVSPFVPGLSIIDAVMNNSIDELKVLISHYEAT